MQIKSDLETLRNFLDLQKQNGVKVKDYTRKEDQLNYFRKINIGVKLEEFKEIILQEETELELGGVDQKSFSLIYPIQELDLIDDGKIRLFGPEIKEISNKTIDFGLFLLIGIDNLSENSFDEFKNLNFISNGIEGFMIRTIPRRFWCRLSKSIINKFSFEFLGNAIMFLYQHKFKEIKSMEIIFINSNPELIESFIDITSSIRADLEQKWKKKVKEWKRRVDCDFDWDCNECPYYDICEDIKEVLEKREVLD
ncbi:MAG: hypothetical protein ACFE8M_04015 [Candidatus Hermodarchaeota archaeon]